MKKIILVGGAGYIGGFMTDYILSQNEFQVTVYDSLLFENRYLKEVDFIYGDIRDFKKLEALLPEFDIIVWLAALVGDGACAINPKTTLQVNYEPVKWLVDNFKHKFIVFMSTCSVYGQNPDLIDEKATPNPLSVYATTKLSSEKYIVEHAKDYLIFRLGTLYGIGDQHSRLRFDLVVNYLTLRAMNKEKLTVFGGQQWRPILHVRDVSTALVYSIKNGIRGLFNLSEKNVVIQDLALEIAANIPGTLVEYAEIKFEDHRDYKVKNDKFLSTGWKPHYSLSDGITELISVLKEGRITDPYQDIYHNAKYLKNVDFSEIKKW